MVGQGRPIRFRTALDEITSTPSFPGLTTLLLWNAGAFEHRSSGGGGWYLASFHAKHGRNGVHRSASLDETERSFRGAPPLGSTNPAYFYPTQATDTSSRSGVCVLHIINLKLFWFWNLCTCGRIFWGRLAPTPNTPPYRVARATANNQCQGDQTAASLNFIPERKEGARVALFSQHL